MSTLSLALVSLRSDDKIASAQESRPPLSADLPGDFHSRQADPDLLVQDDFDFYSWDVFIALNWPADATGKPDPTKKIGNPSPHGVVWESWKAVDDVFREKGREPVPWEAPPRVPEYCAGMKLNLSVIDPAEKFKDSTLQAVVNSREVKILSYIAKGQRQVHSESQVSSTTQAHSTVQAFNSGPLIDRQGKYARYEILLNRTMYDYIVSNDLFSVEGQDKFTRDIAFPCGMFKLDSAGAVVRDQYGRPITENVGSIVVKATWKVLSDEEIKGGRFYIRKAAIVTPKPETQGKDEFVGLVAFHIVHKSENVIQWTWSTFEHVDNCPTKDEAVARSYSFFHPASSLKINRPPDRPWDGAKTEPVSRRCKIVRMIPITNEAKRINDRFHAELTKDNPTSVWQYYDLVSTQWPARPATPRPRNDPDHCNVRALAPADIVGDPTPVFLANTTLESYIQGKTPNVSSSCMECHANAGAMSGRFADFTYILSRAQKRGGE